jgi:hypothetical protein
VSDSIAKGFRLYVGLQRITEENVAPAGIWPALTIPVVPATSETKPFKAAATCDLNILQSRDLAIVLRLLTLAVSVHVYRVLWVFPSTLIDVYTDPRSSGGL